MPPPTTSRRSARRSPARQRRSASRRPSSMRPRMPASRHRHRRHRHRRYRPRQRDRLAATTSRTAPRATSIVAAPARAVRTPGGARVPMTVPRPTVRAARVSSVRRWVRRVGVTAARRALARIVGRRTSDFASIRERFGGPVARAVPVLAMRSVWEGAIFPPSASRSVERPSDSRRVSRRLWRFADDGLVPQSGQLTRAPYPVKKTPGPYVRSASDACGRQASLSSAA